MEPISSIGAHIKIYANNYNETYSIVNMGENLKLNAEIVEISNDTPITWKSYQENVATVNSNGEITAIREGTARIEATATETLANGQTITYTDVYPVIVQDNNVISIQQLLETNGAASGVIPDKVSVGNSEQALIYGEKFNVSWSSSNNEIATISENGLIQGVANGNVTIGANIAYNNTTYQLQQEINVSGGKVEDKDNIEEINGKIEEVKKSEIKSIDNKSTTIDQTTAKTILPQTGKNTTIMFISIFLITVISVIMYKKYKNYKDV